MFNFLHPKPAVSRRPDAVLVVQQPAPAALPAIREQATPSGNMPPNTPPNTPAPLPDSAPAVKAAGLQQLSESPAAAPQGAAKDGRPER